MGSEQAHADGKPVARLLNYAYKVKGAPDDTYTETFPTEPGDYTVRATIPASADHPAYVATADFTIDPMPLTIDSATVQSRAYEKGNTTVAVSDVAFKNSKGEPVALTMGTDYTASGEMKTADTGENKVVTVTVQLKNSSYILAQSTVASTATITKADLPSQDVRVVGYTAEGEGGVNETFVAQNVANMVPVDAGAPLSYRTGTPTTPEGVTVSEFSVGDDGLVTATMAGAKQGDDSNNVTLPVIVEGAVTGGTMQYSLDGETFSRSIPTATNAGDYTVYYKVVGDENHKDTELQSVEVYVGKADPVGDAPGPLSATCGDLLDNVKLPEAENGTWS